MTKPSITGFPAGWSSVTYNQVEGDCVENAELILNLWYVYDDTGVVYSLRARCYVGSGSDEEKLALLRRFAQTDYLIAQPFPVPERFTTRTVEGNTKKKVP